MLVASAGIIIPLQGEKIGWVATVRAAERNTFCCQTWRAVLETVLDDKLLAQIWVPHQGLGRTCTMHPLALLNKIAAY